MRDVPDLFNIKEKYAAMASEARGVLILLGFDGVRDFSKRSGLNHETAGQILGTVKLKHQKNHHLIVRVNEALHTAYMEQRKAMAKPKRAYIVDWAKRWQRWAVDEILRLQSPGKVKNAQDTQEGRRNKKRQEAVKAGVLQALSALKWEN